MPNIITITEFPDLLATNDVVGMALRHDFYFSQIWSFLNRSYPPQQLARLKKLGYSKERIDEEFKDHTSKYRKFGWVCNKLMVNDKMVGFTIWDYPKGGEKCMLEFMFVEPEYRGNGLGNYLVAHFKIQASIFKKTTCKIQVSTFNERLQKFYEDWGWEHGEPESPIDPGYLEMYLILPSLEDANLENKRLMWVREIGEVY